MTVLTQAQQYLAKVLPWPENGEGFIGIHWTYVPANLEAGRKPLWGGRAARTLADAVREVGFGLKGPETRDIYVCLSSQRAADERVSAKGFKYYLPMRNQENAIALKALFLDIDFKGGDSGYNDLNEAIAALATFIKKTGIPRPSIVVHSGGGIHVYWTVSRALTPEDWKPLAFALAEATKREGLKCDVACTIDSARILRVPNTFNRKLDTPRPVQILGKPLDFDYDVERLAQPLEPYKGTLPAQVTRLDRAMFPYKPAIKEDSDLSAGIDPPMLQEELRTCLDNTPNTKIDWNAWNTVGMRCYAAAQGADYGLEEWARWSATNAAANASPKDSCGERWRTYHYSPPTRTGGGALINDVRALLGDPKWTPSKLPPQVTPLPTPAAVAQSDLPKGYTRDADGKIQRIAVQEDGTHVMVPICEYALENPWLQTDPNVLHFTTTIRNKSCPIDLPTEISGTMEMRKYLQAQGLMLPIGAKALENISGFLMSWVQTLQQTRDSVRSAPFGWHVKNSRLEGFIYGGQMFTPTGSSPAASADPVLARQYLPSGDLQPWKYAAKLITDQLRPELEALLASAFAAPLVRFTGLPGALMSAYSIESGCGKSTTVKIAQAVWGDPITAVQSLTDTQNSTMGKLGQLRSLPMYWDELKTEEDTRKFVNITFQVTQGKEKSRMNRNIQQREPGRWQTLLVSASNDSLLDFVLGQTNMTTAGLFRIFEYSMKKPLPTAPGQIDTSDMSLAVAKLHDHYGAVGLEYAKFLGENHAQVEADVAIFLKSIEKEIVASPDERFWAALIAVTCMGARYAKQLGFVDFDEVALKEFMIGILGKMRKVKVDQPVDMTQAMNVSHLLTQFLSAMKAKHTLFTNKINLSKGKPPKGAFKVMRDASRMDGVYVQVGIDDRLMRISSAALGEWLKDKSYSRHVFITALQNEFGFEKVSGILGSGTGDPGVTGGKEFLLQVDYADPRISKFFDEV